MPVITKYLDQNGTHNETNKNTQTLNNTTGEPNANQTGLQPRAEVPPPIHLPRSITIINPSDTQESVIYSTLPTEQPEPTGTMPMPSIPSTFTAPDITDITDTIKEIKTSVIVLMAVIGCMIVVSFIVNMLHTRKSSNRLQTSLEEGFRKLGGEHEPLIAVHHQHHHQPQQSQQPQQSHHHEHGASINNQRGSRNGRGGESIELTPMISGAPSGSSAAQGGQGGAQS
ncbi:hypothetical protein F5Y06DRAFT_303822 [Hypoxylon sp. FL0890]|nr:hypothetical protein F5Y06DRAFT_303822 [Hypoxylon sp. FL0890]